jgi:tetratricopeptide (TPR) repeat protein
MRSLVLVVVALATAACLEPPGVGRAADPSKAEGHAPWGSATDNVEMAKKVRLLEDILDGKLAAVDLPKRVENDWPRTTPEERKKSLQGITDLLEDLKGSGKARAVVPAGPDRDMAFAQLYFSERRFIEAATLLSRLLDTSPTYPHARNLLARCFFFLQNRDRTLAELEYVLTNAEHQKDRDEILDALFLMGAAVAETPGMTRENLEKGKNAWETYLKLAPDSPQKPQIDKGLDEMRQGLRGEGRLAQPLVPIASESGDEAAVNPMGGAVQRGGKQPAPMGPSSAPAGATQSRVSQLAPDASPVSRALAEGLDALESKDLATAERKLVEVSSSPSPTRVLSEARVGLGRVYVQSGRFDEALRAFGEVIKQDPTFMPAWHYNGMALMMSGSPEQAVQSWEKIVEKDPAYARQFKLEQRIDVAKRMSQQR